MFEKLKSSGVTIIELMITLVHLAWSLVFAFIQSYGISFTRGESLVTRQQNIRMVTRILSEDPFLPGVVVDDSLEEPDYVYYWADAGSILKDRKLT